MTTTRPPGGVSDGGPSTVSEFYDTLDEIEKYLGYLKGNELAHDYLMTMWGDLVTQYESSEGHVSKIALDWEYKFPCAEERFKVRPGAHWNPGRQAGRHLRSPGRLGRLREGGPAPDGPGLQGGHGMGRGDRGLPAEPVCPVREARRHDSSGTRSSTSTVMWWSLWSMHPTTTGPTSGDSTCGGPVQAAASFNDFYANYNDAARPVRAVRQPGQRRLRVRRPG